MQRHLRAAARRTGLRRDHLVAVHTCCERSLLAAWPAPRQAPAGRILCYHAIGTPQWGVNDVAPARFRRQIELALQAGYRFVPAGKIARGEGEANELAITFDDGLASVAKSAAPLLAGYGIPWTLFVVSDWADGKHAWGDGIMLGWDAIERLAADGAVIGSHSVTHPDFSRLTTGDALYELAESRERIEQRIGIRPRDFAIPLGRSRNWTTEAVATARTADYAALYALSGKAQPHGTVARTLITRFDGDRVFRAVLGGSFDRS